MLLYSKNYHNIVKQLSSKKKKKRNKEWKKEALEIYVIYTLVFHSELTLISIFSLEQRSEKLGGL